MKTMHVLILLVFSFALTSCKPPTESADPAGDVNQPVEQPDENNLIDDAIVVTSTADSGPGSLRQAILDAHNGDTITFDPSVFPPSAPVSISIDSELPLIGQGNLTLDASNTGVILDGSNVTGDWVSGLQMVSDENTIQGFQVSNFSGTGIAISDGAHNLVGGDRSIGAGPYGQGNLTILNDVGIGLWGSGASSNTITGNLIGSDETDANDLGNHNAGVIVIEGASNNVIGPDNIIAFNGEEGVFFEASNNLENTVIQNNIYGNGIGNDVGVEVGDSQTAPSVIFHNGTILTIDENFTQAEAIAVRSGLIQAVGTNEDILALQGPETFLVDLQGKTLLPGFIDGHTHILAFPDRMDRSIDEAQETAIRYGFTTVNEMWADQNHLNNLAQAEHEGGLRLRVNAFANYNAGVLDENHQNILIKAWFPENGPILDPEKHFRVPGIKVFVDGAFTPARGCWALSSPIERDAWMLEAGICGSENGDLYWSQDELNQVVSEAQNAGYRVAFHAMGDQAIETTLNAIEFALNGQPNEQHRHQIQHNSLTRPDQFSRYEDLDVLVSVRGFADLCDPQLGLGTFGPDRQNWYANRYALPNLDIHAYLETDFGWTVDPDDRFDQRALDPIIQLFGFVTHQFVTENGETCDPVPWAAVHTINVERALQMLTIEPAYAVSMEDYIGSLESGKYADLIILSDNPLEVDLSEIIDIQVLMTMIGGQTEFCLQEYESLCP